MISDDSETLQTATSTLRDVVLTEQLPGTASYGLFALAHLLEELARARRGSRPVAEGVHRAGVEIARHVLDHGCRLQ